VYYSPFVVESDQSHKKRIVVDPLPSNAVHVSCTETTVELIDLLQIGKHPALQPDLQYGMRPGTNPMRKGALAVALRFELSS
jgi:carbohydrate-selective porin OprB